VSSEQAEKKGTDWAAVGQMIEEMAAAGFMVELHKTAQSKGFAWSFARRTDFKQQKIWTYGETAGQAVERGYERWYAEWQASIAGIKE
jgi:hypothetical protein